MAKIVLSDAAPSDETLRFSFAGLEEAQAAPFETNNREAIANAVAHPWLNVEYDEADVDAAATSEEFDTRLTAAEDHLSSVNDHSNAPEEVAAEADRRREEFGLAQPLAVDAGLVQDKPKFAGPVAITLAADDTDNDEVSE